ncbi:Retrovirus-related Pol polyprotein from transposon TNT 1-94 [Araneus ventricosus]|uniref:Retrovirus-related Pol polyprotein from transposon TNT 1-94 n=1 Tax=Araneus ventricosus TaxID=182803 RepID=A0A4Y2FQW3_ARAVE|nr:Retrovirus-related Pol polyprotein from transposon TNT 1-94 [Araneus ventricosus]
MDNFLEELKTIIKVYIGEVSCFLGLEIERHKDGSIEISQKAYARKILQRFGFEGCKPASTPMLKESRFQKPEDNKRQEFAIGSLMYLMVDTRPDITYSVGYISRSLESPTAEYVVRVKRVFRYIAGTTNVAITYHATGTSRVLECYSDADFGGCTKTGRSSSGSVIVYAGGA